MGYSCSKMIGTSSTALLCLALQVTDDFRFWFSWHTPKILEFALYSHTNNLLFIYLNPACDNVTSFLPFCSSF